MMEDMKMNDLNDMNGTTQLDELSDYHTLLPTYLQDALKKVVEAVGVEELEHKEPEQQARLLDVDYIQTLDEVIARVRAAYPQAYREGYRT